MARRAALFEAASDEHRTYALILKLRQNRHRGEAQSGDRFLRPLDCDRREKYVPDDTITVGRHKRERSLASRPEQVNKLRFKCAIKGALVHLANRGNVFG